MKYGLFAFVLLMSFACGEKHNEGSDDGEWKEMEEFHTIMADVYHPLKDSNNLEPIKKRSEELAGAAEKWASAELPAKVDNQETKDMLGKLQTDCMTLESTITDGASDEEIAKQLTAVHEEFHSIMERWHDQH